MSPAEAAVWAWLGAIVAVAALLLALYVATVAAERIREARRLEAAAYLSEIRLQRARLAQYQAAPGRVGRHAAAGVLR